MGRTNSWVGVLVVPILDDVSSPSTGPEVLTTLRVALDSVDLVAGGGAGPADRRPDRRPAENATRGAG